MNLEEVKQALDEYPDIEWVRRNLPRLTLFVAAARAYVDLMEGAEPEDVECPRCEGNGEHLTHPDQDCDVCASLSDWGEHVMDCERCAGSGRIRVRLVPVSEETP